MIRKVYEYRARDRMGTLQQGAITADGETAGFRPKSCSRSADCSAKHYAAVLGTLAVMLYGISLVSVMPGVRPRVDALKLKLPVARFCQK